jgi:hypothetical protein
LSVTNSERILDRDGDSVWLGSLSGLIRELERVDRFREDLPNAGAWSWAAEDASIVREAANRAVQAGVFCKLDY